MSVVFAFVAAAGSGVPDRFVRSSFDGRDAFIGRVDGPSSRVDGPGPIAAS